MYMNGVIVKILHTSDWHLGRQFYGQSLEADHAVFITQVIAAIERHDPDVLVIAGDIFDRASPPAEAVRQFNEFVEHIAARSRAAIVLIAGNHDSGDRIGSLAALADRNRFLIRGPLSREERPLVLNDEFGPVAFSALPYGNEFAAREQFENSSIASPADVVAAQVTAARIFVPAGARWVVIAHAFVSNGASSESERRLTVGGIETVAPNVFAGAHYVALGHLHRPQCAGAPHIRYSGSPLAFGFDEGDVQKSMTLIHMNAGGDVLCNEIPITPQRRVRTVRGAFADLLAMAIAEPSDDFLKIIVTDTGALVDPMGRLREYYPNALVLSFGDGPAAEIAKVEGASTSAISNPVIVVDQFFAQARANPLEEDERILVVAALNQLSSAEGAA